MEIKIDYTKKYMSQLLIKFIAVIFSCSATIYFCGWIKNSDKIRVMRSNFDTIQMACFVIIFFAIIYVAVLFKRWIFKQPHINVSREGVNFTDILLIEKSFLWSDLEYINFSPFVIKSRKEYAKTVMKTSKLYDKEDLKQEILRNFRYEIRSNNVKIQGHDFEYEKTTKNDAKIEIFYTMKHMKFIILIDALVIPFCTFLILFGDLSTRYRHGGNAMAIVLVALIVGILWYTIYIAKEYFLKRPCIIINENGVIFSKNQTKSAVYSWNLIKSMSFTDKVTIKLKTDSQEVHLNTLNLDVDPAELSNQILSKFREEIEYFNIEFR